MERTTCTIEGYVRERPPRRTPILETHYHFLGVLLTRVMIKIRWEVMAWHCLLKKAISIMLLLISIDTLPKYALDVTENHRYSLKKYWDIIFKDLEISVLWIHFILLILFTFWLSHHLLRTLLESLSHISLLKLLDFMPIPKEFRNNWHWEIR